MTDISKHNYASYKFDSIEEIFQAANILPYDWVFRGHADASWDIESSLEREVNRHNHKFQMIAEAEKQSLKHIKHASALGLEHGLNAEDDFSWLALLQHHGCKTRLIDFTESFYVALYFAVNEMREYETENDSRMYIDTAVWAVSTENLDTVINTYCFRSKEGFSEQEAKERLVNNSVSDPWRYVDSDEFHVVCGKPKELNNRLISQQGLFLCPLTITRSFKDSLTKALRLTGSKEPVRHLQTMDDLRQAKDQEDVIKFIIPGHLLRNTLFHLKKMNITEATLFPGLDGFARSLNYFAIGM